MAGRKTKLTPEVATKILQALQGGASRRAAFGSVGIHEATFYNWIARGEKATRGKFFEFFEGVSKAEAAAVLRNHFEIWRVGTYGNSTFQGKFTPRPDRCAL